MKKKDLLLTSCTKASYINAQLEKVLGDVFENSLTARQALIMLTLKKNPNASMKYIEEKLGLSQQTTAFQCKTMKADKLISVAKDEGDSRIKRVNLEPSGLSILSKHENKLDYESSQMVDLEEITKDLCKIESLLNERLQKKKKNK